MKVFSKRNNIEANKIGINGVSCTLNMRILNIFIEFSKKEGWLYDKFTYIEQVMTELGFPYSIPFSVMDNDKNATNLRFYYTGSNETEWYHIYDFIEKSLYVSKNKNLESEYDRILREEGAFYRVIRGLVVPITNDEEIKSINKTLNTKYEPVNKHINKALELIQNRSNPDYENSIKESISAVESLCSIVTGTKGKSSSLGNTLDLLDEKGIYIHKSLKEAYKKIYGYASDEKGIRHAGEIENGAHMEDAVYMLVSCSAFINYLMDKYSKV